MPLGQPRFTNISEVADLNQKRVFIFANGLNPDPGSAIFMEPQLHRGGEGQIDYSVTVKGSPVVNAHNGAFAVSQICHTSEYRDGQ